AVAPPPGTHRRRLPDALPISPSLVPRRGRRRCVRAERRFGFAAAFVVARRGEPIVPCWRCSYRARGALVAAAEVAVSFATTRRGNPTWQLDGAALPRRASQKCHRAVTAKPRRRCSTGPH